MGKPAEGWEGAGGRGEKLRGWLGLLTAKKRGKAPPSSELSVIFLTAQRKAYETYPHCIGN